MNAAGYPDADAGAGAGSASLPMAVPQGTFNVARNAQASSELLRGVIEASKISSHAMSLTSVARSSLTSSAGANTPAVLSPSSMRMASAQISDVGRGGIGSTFVEEDRGGSQGVMRVDAKAVPMTRARRVSIPEASAVIIPLSTRMQHASSTMSTDLEGRMMTLEGRLKDVNTMVKRGPTCSRGTSTSLHSKVQQLLEQVGSAREERQQEEARLEEVEKAIVQERAEREAWLREFSTTLKVTLDSLNNVVNDKIVQHTQQSRSRLDLSERNVLKLLGKIESISGPSHKAKVSRTLLQSEVRKVLHVPAMKPEAIDEIGSVQLAMPLTLRPVPAAGPNASSAANVCVNRSLGRTAQRSPLRGEARTAPASLRVQASSPTSAANLSVLGQLSSPTSAANLSVLGQPSPPTSAANLSAPGQLSSPTSTANLSAPGQLLPPSRFVTGLQPRSPQPLPARSQPTQDKDKIPLQSRACSNAGSQATSPKSHSLMPVQSISNAGSLASSPKSQNLMPVQSTYNAGSQATSSKSYNLMPLQSTSPPRQGWNGGSMRMAAGSGGGSPAPVSLNARERNPFCSHSSQLAPSSQPAWLCAPHPRAHAAWSAAAR